MVNPVVSALVCGVVACVVVPVVLMAFRANFNLPYVIAACVAAAATMMVPVVGGWLSLLVMVGVLNWRSGADLKPDILVAVIVARLAMVPAMLTLH